MMAVSLVHVPITPTLNVMSLHREHSREPLFVLREFDVKVLRQVVHNRNKKKSSDDDDDEDVKTSSPQQKNKRMDGGEMQFMVTGSSEQALRVSIRAAVLRLGLAMEAATAHEIKLLKDADVLGKRAPSASLLTGTDMCRLLRAFGANAVATKLCKQLDTLEPGILIPSSGDADMDNTSRRKSSSSTRVKHENDENSIVLKKRKSRERMKRESPSSSPAYSRPRSLSHGHRPLEGDSNSYVSDDDASSLSSDEHAAAGGYVPSRSYQRGSRSRSGSGSGSGSGSSPSPIYDSQSSIPSSSFHSQPQHFHANPSYQPPTFPQFESTQHRNSTYSTSHTQTRSHKHPTSTTQSQSHPHSMENGNQIISTTTNPSHAHVHAELIHPDVLHATPSTGSSDSHSHSYDHIDHHYHHHTKQSTTHNTIRHTNGTGTYHGTHHTTTGTIIQPTSSQSDQQQQLHIQQQQQQQQHQQQQQQSFHSQSSRGQTSYEPTGISQHSRSIINDSNDAHHQFIAPHQRHLRPPPILAPSACPPSQYPSSHHTRSNKRGAAAISPQIQTSSKQIILGFPNPSKQRITPITIPTQSSNNQYIAHNLNAFVNVVSPAVSGNNTPTASVSLPVSSPAASTSNSTPSTSIQHSIVRPSVSTQHLSSLRAFSAHPFNKRRSTNSGLAIDEHIIDTDTDLSDLLFPPLSERVETLRVDTSSLLPKALIITNDDDTQTSSSTMDSSDSSTHDDIMESMDGLDDVDIDHAFEISNHDNNKNQHQTSFDSAFQTAATIKHETSNNSVFDAAFQAAKLLHQKNRSLHTHHHTHLSHPVPAMAS